MGIFAKYQNHEEVLLHIWFKWRPFNFFVLLCVNVLISIVNHYHGSQMWSGMRKLDLCVQNTPIHIVMSISFFIRYSSDLCVNCTRLTITCCTSDKILLVLCLDNKLLNFEIWKEVRFFVQISLVRATNFDAKFHHFLGHITKLQALVNSARGFTHRFKFLKRWR